jgi:hypothetical protein
LNTTSEQVLIIDGQTHAWVDKKEEKRSIIIYHGF